MQLVSTVSMGMKSKFVLPSRISSNCYFMGSSIFNPLTLFQTTNFRLFQTESVCRRVSNLMKMAESFNMKKTLWEKHEENTAGKKEIARYEQFLVFTSVFKTCSADT